MSYHKSSEYNEFHSDLTNRPITEADRAKLRLLRASMDRHGWLSAYPMLVVRNGKGYIIKDGQHRFEVAKELKIPVLYVVEPGSLQLDIPLINSTQKVWTISDYVGSYTQQGKPEYHFLVEFANRHGMTVMRAASLLNGEVATNANVNDRVKQGEFRVKDVEYAEKVGSLAHALSRHVSWAKGSLCLGALSRLVRVEAFNPAHLIDKADKNPGLLRKQPTQDAYTQMFEEIYNYASKSGRIPLAFLAAEVMSARRDVGALRKAKSRSAAA